MVRRWLIGPPRASSRLQGSQRRPLCDLEKPEEAQLCIYGDWKGVEDRKGGEKEEEGGSDVKSGAGAKIEFRGKPGRSEERSKTFLFDHLPFPHTEDSQNLFISCPSVRHPLSPVSNDLRVLAME